MKAIYIYIYIPIVKMLPISFISLHIFVAPFVPSIAALFVSRILSIKIKFKNCLNLVWHVESSLPVFLLPQITSSSNQCSD